MMPGRRSFRGIGRRGLLAAAGSLFAAPSIVRARSRDGVALVIGNSKYQWEAQLPNVRRDAPDIAGTFRAMGLETELIQDAGQGAMQEAIARFGEAARNAGFAAFYFAGHGTQWDRDTYLVPIDADLSSPKSDGLVSTRSVNRACRGAHLNARIFDNCRNNPADGWRQKQADDRSRITGVDLANFTRDNPNSLAIFSTVPGRTALDGPAGQNSPFAAALLRLLDRDTVELSSLARNLRREVLIATRGQQVVVDFSSYDREVSIKGGHKKGRPAGAVGGAIGGTSLVELDKAYAFARENKILLPQGLVAFRPSNDALLAQKIGSFKFTETVGNRGPQELVLIILSADSGNAVQVLLAGPSNNGWWRFINGKIEGSRLEFQAYNQPSSPHFDFRWRDANSGQMTISWPHSTNARFVHSPFQRLDG